MGGGNTDSILRMLPVMRQFAREGSPSQEKADELVALALKRAIADVDGFTSERYLEEWLMSHLDASLQQASDPSVDTLN